MNAAAIARALGGRVRGSRVIAPGPGQKPRDRSLTIWVAGDGFRVHSHRHSDWRVIKDYVRDRAGIPWQPTRKRAPKPIIPFAIRNHFVGEDLAIARHRGRITAEQFALLVNDLRLRGETGDALRYAREFGFSAADLERATLAPRHFTADERAAIFNLSYAERQALGLRRTGSVEVDKAGRERARRDRYNAKRRAARTAARACGVNRRGPSSRKVVRVAPTGVPGRFHASASQNVVLWHSCSVEMTPHLGDKEYLTDNDRTPADGPVMLEELKGVAALHLGYEGEIIARLGGAAREYVGKALRKQLGTATCESGRWRGANSVGGPLRADWARKPGWFRPIAAPRPANARHESDARALRRRVCRDRGPSARERTPEKVKTAIAALVAKLEGRSACLALPPQFSEFVVTGIIHLECKLMRA